MMDRAELVKELHRMVDTFAEFPQCWLDDGIYPLISVSFRDKETGDHYKLVVGVNPDRDE